MPYSRGPIHLGISFALIPLSCIFVALRFYCRAAIVRNVGKDDWIMLLALLTTIGLAVMNIFQIKYGSGTHMKDLKKGSFLPTLKLWYFYQITYLLALCFIKFSILAFYIRISSEKKYRLSVIVTAIVVGVYTVVMVLVNAFECTNPSDAWAPTFPKGCHDLVIVYYLQAGFNIASDLVILILPMPTLMKLQVNATKKYALIAIFSVGSMAVIASIVRLNALYIYHHSKDIPFDAIWLLTWSQIELNVAIVSASSPSLKPLFKSVFGGSTFGRSLYGKRTGASYGDSSMAMRSRKGDQTLHSQVTTSKFNESEEEIITSANNENGIRRTTQIDVSVSKQPSLNNMRGL